MTATDYDADELVYSLHPLSSDLRVFSINSSTGIISNAENLDREVSSGEK